MFFFFTLLAQADADPALAERVARLPGVGDISFLGQRDYSMRVWLDPERLTAMNLSPQDVVSAVYDQNQQAAIGSVGAAPTVNSPSFNLTLVTKGRLMSEQDFGDIIDSVNAVRGETMAASLPRLRELDAHVDAVEDVALAHGERHAVKHARAVAVGLGYALEGNDVRVHGAEYSSAAATPPSRRSP